MCGLVGIAGKLEFKDEATMKRLLILDVFRGQDSTGFAGIRANGDAKIAKLASHPLDLFELPKFKEALNGNSSRVFLGHNRAATRGLVNTFNAHPFQYDHIIGAHNGTLETGCVKVLEEAVGEKFGVDSQALFAAIAKLGVEEAIPLIREGKDSQTGAWSLVWYDQNDGTLNFLRNKHRPLWYAYNKEFDRIFWASEWPMIEAAVQMSTQGYDFYAEANTGFRFFSTQENIHYSFDVAALKAGSKERPKPKAKEIRGKEPLAAAATGSNYDPFNRREGSGGPIQTTTILRGTQRSRSDKKNDPDIINWIGSASNPFAGYFDEETFNELAKYGCSYCGTDIEWGESGVTIFERDDVILCPGCSGHSSGNSSAPSRIFVKNLDLLL